MNLGSSTLDPRATSPRSIGISAGLLAAVALLLLVARINYPPVTFWDESSYVNIARSLLHGNLAPLPHEFSTATFGRQHPPLGPYIIEAGMKVAGDNPFGWRLAGALCGVVSVIAIYFWCYLLLRDSALAATAAILTLLNNFLFVMSRIGMLDIFLFTFSILSVLALTAALELEVSLSCRRILTASSGVLIGMALAVKWNAVDTLAAIFLVAGALLLAVRYFAIGDSRVRMASQNIKAIGIPALFMCLTALPALTYVISFMPLMRATNMPISMHEFISLHAQMLKLTNAAPGNPAQYAAWYSWPFRITPNRGLSYLVGNPAVMWVGVAAVLVCAARLRNGFKLPETMVVSLYGLNLLQWIVTPIKVPNYYYYFPAAMFLAPAIAVALQAPTPKKLFGIRPAMMVILSAVIIFLYCYPRMSYLESPWDCMFGCW